MRRISGKCFCNREVRLDGHAFVDCSFESCRLIYAGRKPFSLTGNLISSDSVLVLTDRAADTIAALEGLSDLGNWGRSNVTSVLGPALRSTPQNHDVATPHR